MPDVMLPQSFVVLLAAFAECFAAPSYANFCQIVAGWVHCLGRRTITGVALASGAVGSRHISVFHRFFSRATWVLDELGHGVFRLALAWLPADQPVLVLGDDTLIPWPASTARAQRVPRAGLNASRSFAVYRAEAVLPLRPRLGGVGSVDPAADGQGAGLCPADPVPAISRQATRRSGRRSLPPR